MAGSGTYTAEALAYRAGIPLRTVRFYLHEKVLDPPLGRGRGAHFTDHHLYQLQQARTLQNAGLSLDEIRERRNDLMLGIKAASAWDRFLKFHTEGEPIQDVPSEDELDPAHCIRIPMTDGVELLIADDKSLPSPKQLVEVALLIRKVFLIR